MQINVNPQATLQIFAAKERSEQKALHGLIGDTDPLGDLILKFDALPRHRIRVLTWRIDSDLAQNPNPLASLRIFVNRLWADASPIPSKSTVHNKKHLK